VPRVSPDGGSRSYCGPIQLDRPPSGSLHERAIAWPRVLRIREPHDSRSASCLVPTARLELAQLSPPPPQHPLSTNSTTSAIPTINGRIWTRTPARGHALLRNILGFRAIRGRLGRLIRRGRSRDRRLSRWPLGFMAIHDAALLRLVAGYVCQPHAR